MGIKFSKVSIAAGLDACIFFIPGHLEEPEEVCVLPQYRSFCGAHPSWSEIEVEVTSYWFGEDHSNRDQFKDADRDHLLLMASFGSLYGGWRENPASYPLVCAGGTHCSRQRNTEEPRGAFSFRSL